MIVLRLNVDNEFGVSVESMARPHLRRIAGQIGVPIENAEGNEKDTRTMGSHVIRRVNDVDG